MPARLGNVLPGDAVRATEPLQVLPERRALALPAPHPDVDVIALREDPAVAARDRAELDDGLAPVALGPSRPVRDVSLERDAVLDIAGKSQCASGDPIRPVGPHERRG